MRRSSSPRFLNLRTVCVHCTYTHVSRGSSEAGPGHSRQERRLSRNRGVRGGLVHHIFTPCKGKFIFRRGNVAGAETLRVSGRWGEPLCGLEAAQGKESNSRPLLPAAPNMTFAFVNLGHPGAGAANEAGRPRRQSLKLDDMAAVSNFRPLNSKASEPFFRGRLR